MRTAIIKREKGGIQILDLQGHLIEGIAEGSLSALAVVVALGDARVVNVRLNFAQNMPHLTNWLLTAFPNVTRN